MNRFFMGCLAVLALALMIGQAVAGGENFVSNAANAVIKKVPPADEAGWVVESYTSSAVVVPSENADENMQPLPDSPGVEVAPLDTPVDQPIMVEDDMLIQETEAGE